MSCRSSGEARPRSRRLWEAGSSPGSGPCNRARPSASSTRPRARFTDSAVGRVLRRAQRQKPPPSRVPLESRLNAYFNTAAFNRAPSIPAGGSDSRRFPGLGGGDGLRQHGVNILRGPGQANLDLGIFKRFSLGEERRLEFRAEFFNALNQVNFDLPGSSVSTPATFGVISDTTAAPRVIQFALRLMF